MNAGIPIYSKDTSTLVGLKQQASGWPQGCETLEQKQRYLAEFEQVEGIRLEMAKVEFNPGLRMIAVIFFSNFQIFVNFRKYWPTHFGESWHSVLEELKFDMHVLQQNSIKYWRTRLSTRWTLPTLVRKWTDVWSGKRLNLQRHLRPTAYPSQHSSLHMLGYICTGICNRSTTLVVNSCTATQIRTSTLQGKGRE